MANAIRVPRRGEPRSGPRGRHRETLKTWKQIPGPKPAFWVEAGIHANELEPPEVAMKLASWLLDGYQVDADARWLVDNREVYILFAINPDGREYVEQSGPFVWVWEDRKNADPAGCSDWPAQPCGSALAQACDSRLGIDLNRNFPFAWGSGVDLPCNRYYRGPAVLSEPESAAVHKYVLSLFGSHPVDPAPTQPVAGGLSVSGTFLDLHSAGGNVMVPWLGAAGTTPDQTDIINIGLHLAMGGHGAVPKQGIGMWLCATSVGDGQCYGPHYPGSAIDTVYSQTRAFAAGIELTPGHLDTLD